MHTSLTDKPNPGFMRAGHSTDMELKKSISDTERALRSYGAVSETAWTTDKGERHASICDVVLPPAGRKTASYRLGFLSMRE